MPTDNVVEAILGRKAVKWDAFWHLFEWLVNPDEGHGLGNSIRCQLLRFAFGELIATCSSKREYPVSGQTNGKGKFVDFALAVPTFDNPTHLILMDDIGAVGSGNQRKLKNLLEYRELSRLAHPSANIRVVAITDAPVGKRLGSAVYVALGDEATEFTALTGWRLLPLQTIGVWVRDAMSQEQEHLTEKAKIILEELACWCD